MTKEHLLVFHSRTAQGWEPGNFMARTRIDEDAARRMNDQFHNSGVKVIPLKTNRERRFAPFQIE